MKRVIIALVAIFMLISSGVSFSTAESKKFETLSAEKFAEALKDEKIQIVDVRSDEEFKEGHIEKAINIDVKQSDVKQKFAKLDKKRVIAIYCRSGARSKVVSQKLSEKGFKVIMLDKGLLSWKGKLVK